MADSDDNADAFRKLQDYLSRIRADDAAFDEDPYQLGVDVHAFAHDHDLLAELRLGSVRDILAARLPDLKLQRMLDAGTVAGALPREWATKYAWEKVVPYAYLIDRGVVPKPSGDPAAEKIPLRSVDGKLTHKGFIDCTPEELQRTLEWARRPPPPPEPRPPDVPEPPVIPDVPAAPSPTAVKAIWIGLGLMAVGAALGNVCGGSVMGGAGAAVIAATVGWLRWNGQLLSFLGAVVLRLKSGDWPKRRVVSWGVVVLVVGIAVRAWKPKSPFERATRSLHSISTSLPRALPPPTPPASGSAPPPMVSAPPTPAAPTPLPRRPTDSKVPAEGEPVHPEDTREAGLPLPVHSESSRGVTRRVRATAAKKSDAVVAAHATQVPPSAPNAGPTPGTDPQVQRRLDCMNYFHAHPRPNGRATTLPEIEDCIHNGIPPPPKPPPPPAAPPDPSKVQRCLDYFRAHPLPNGKARAFTEEDACFRNGPPQ